MAVPLQQPHHPEVALEEERLKSYIITQIMAPKWPLITALKRGSAARPRLC